MFRGGICLSDEEEEQQEVEAKVEKPEMKEANKVETQKTVTVETKSEGEKLQGELPVVTGDQVKQLGTLSALSVKAIPLGKPSPYQKNVFIDSEVMKKKGRRSPGQWNALFNPKQSKQLKREVRSSSASFSMVSNIVPSAAQKSGETAGMTLEDAAARALEKLKPKEASETVNFAGQLVNVVKGTAETSATAKLQSQGSQAAGEAGKAVNSKRSQSQLDKIVESVHKKHKSINTLEKSSLDWEKYKKDANLETEELKKYKEKGYVEKQLFMQRVDQRVFEKEKENRQILREYRERNAPQQQK